MGNETNCSTNQMARKPMNVNKNKLFNVVYKPCHGETRLRQYVAWVKLGLVIRLAHAQSSVITEDGEQGFSETPPIF